MKNLIYIIVLIPFIIGGIWMQAFANLLFWRWVSPEHGDTIFWWLTATGIIFAGIKHLFVIGRR